MARILICDDSSFMRLMLRKILTDHGHELWARPATAKKPWKCYKQHRPDVTTMDITMPEMNGLEAVKLIHAEDCLARIVMVTAIGQKEIMKEASWKGPVTLW